MSKTKRIEQIEELARALYGTTLSWAECVNFAGDLYSRGFRLQREGKWIDRYNGEFANSLYICSLCDERAPLYIKADELGNEQIVQMLSQFCPNCGAKMKGG